MPVSPRDFELYSRMTGAPMPSDPMSRMQMAPEVYKFTKDFAKRPNLLQKTGNLVKNIGKTAVMAVGAPMVAESLAEQERMSRQAREQAAEPKVTMSGGEEKVVEEPKTAAVKKIEAEMELEKLKQANKIEIMEKKEKAKQVGTALINKVKKDSEVDPPQFELVGLQEEDVQEPTTADAYSQDRVETQTAIGLIDKKNEQAAQLTTDDTVAEVLSESQDSIPEAAYTDKFGLQQIGGSDIRSKADQIIKKAKSDPLLALAFSQRNKKEELIDDSSIPIAPLLDNVDSAADGGEDMSNIPGQNNHRSSGINTGATINLNQRKQEIEETVRKGLGTLSQKQQEKVVESMMSPSDKQVNLLEQREIDNENAIKSGFMKLDDEGRKKESIRLGSNYGIPNKTDMQEIRKDPEYIAAQKSMLPNSVTSKVDEFTNKFMPNKPSSFVESMSLQTSPNKAPTATFNLYQKDGSTQPFTYGISSPMAVSLNEMAEDESLKDESFGKIMNLIKKSAKDGTGMGFSVDQ